VHLLVSLPYVIAQCRVVDYLKSVTDVSNDMRRERPPRCYTIVY